MNERRIAAMPLIRLERTGKLQKQRGKLIFVLLIIIYEITLPSNKSRAKKWCFHCSQWLTKQSHFSRVKLNLAPATCPRKSNCTIFSPAKRLFKNFWTLCKPWPNGVTSRPKTWVYFSVYLWLGLARPCVHLRWLGMTCVHFGRDQICTPVKVSFSPFDGQAKSTQVEWRPLTYH